MIIKVGYEVHCARIGSDIYKVVGEDDRHYFLKDDVGVLTTMYKVHCYMTPALTRMNVKRAVKDRAEKAANIGNRKIRPGKTI